MFIGGREPLPIETGDLVLGGCGACLCDIIPEEIPEDDFECTESFLSLLSLLLLASDF